MRKLKSELDRDDYVSKRRTTKTGRATGGKPFERGALYAILKNQTYLGLTTHKSEVFDGEHDPIIDKLLFDQVQSILSSNRTRDQHKTGTKDPSLLSGKIITDAGITLTPTHSQTHGRRYRYYVERRKPAQAATLLARPIRLPAQEMEASVCNEITTYLSDPVRLIDDLGLKDSAQGMLDAVGERASNLGRKLKASPTQTIDHVLIRSLVQRVELMPDVKGYALTINLPALVKALELSNTPAMETATLHVRMELKVCNNGKKVIIGNKPVMTPAPNTSLINALKTAHEIKQQYMGPNAKRLSDIAEAMKLDKRHVWRTLRLAFLAPDIQLAILSGMQPCGLLVKDLLYQAVPTSWVDQRAIFGL